MEDLNQRQHDAEEQCDQQFHTLPTFVSCTFLGNSLKGSRNHQGFIEKIALNKLSLELIDDYCTIQESLLIYSPLEMTMMFHFPNRLHKVTLTGMITRSERLRKKDKSCLHLETRLYELNETQRAILKEYLYLGIGDKNLVWNLWDTLLTGA
jgi:hypothetical protein